MGDRTPSPIHFPPGARVGPTPESATRSAAGSKPGPQAPDPHASAFSAPTPGAGRSDSRDGAPGRRDPLEIRALEPEVASDHPSPHGADLVQLRFSANPALPLGGLDQASGGELGRVFLALGLEAPANAALLVFDEVDQNVGARLGTAVGACLERMSHSRQVLAITHLAPVAARARLHHRITKRKGVTRVETLAGEDRVEELALMIRGEPLTEAARAQARELLEEAQESVLRSKAPKKPRAKKRSSAKTSPAKDKRTKKASKRTTSQAKRGQSKSTQSKSTQSKSTHAKSNQSRKRPRVQRTGAA